MAIDDHAYLHERVGPMLRSMAERSSLTEWIAAYPSYFWQVSVAPIYGVLGCYSAWFLWKNVEHRRVRWLPLLAVLCWIGAVGLDFAEGLDAHTPGHPYTRLAQGYGMQEFAQATFDRQPYDMIVHFGRVVEECLETTGVVLFGAAILLLVGQSVGRVRRQVATATESVVDA